MRNQGKQQGRKRGRRIEINYVKTSAEGGDESERSESAREKGAEGHHRGREQGGRRVERSITSGPGVVTLKRVNGREPNFPPTHFFSLRLFSLYFFSGKPSQRVSVLLTLLLSSSSLPLTTPYISQPFNTTLYFCSFLVSADLHGDK